MSEKIKVSVCMITYGHEKFIEEAINGVLMQEIDFEIELIVSNDASPDNTHEVVMSIIENHPRGSWIKYIKQESNLGMMPNSVFILKACKGEFIAICEGDDYWIDPLKLKRQVDFLELNDEYVIHSGNAIQLTADSNLCGKPLLNIEKSNCFELKDFLTQNNIITCTVMFRNVKFKFPKDFEKVTFGDWMLYVILIKNSGQKAYLSTDCLSVYRSHSEGVMNNLSKYNYYNTHIFQIVTIYKYLKIKRLDRNVISILNNFYLEKFRIEVKSRSYINIFKTSFLHFKTTSTSMPFRKYLSALKQEFLTF